MRTDSGVSTQIETEFFGEVDRRGSRAVKFFASKDFSHLYEGALQDMLLYMSSQKLRTPKGMDWLIQKSRLIRKRDILEQLINLRNLYGAIWAECVWQLVDARDSQVKFIVSDHPVTVFNRACAPGSPVYCRGPNEPDIWFEGTHTLFPLSSEVILILTNLGWACNPTVVPTTTRPNPNPFRGAIFNFLDIHTGRSFTDEDVWKINWILKSRAYQFVAAGKEDWLFPETQVHETWRDIGQSHFLMPDPKHLIPNAETTVAYADGSYSFADSYGRVPGDPEFGIDREPNHGWVELKRWQAEFRQLFGDAPRGGPLSPP